jgi:hypothetical protein
MKKFGPLRAIVMSFYSAELYRDVGRNWKGTGLLYLMVLLAICWVPTAYRMHAGLHRFAAQTPAITADFPDISIKNGVMQSRPPGRFELRDPDPRPGREAAVFIVVDDTIDDVPSDLAPDTIMLTRRELGISRSNRAERRIIELSAVGNLDVTRQDIAGFLSSLRFWVPPVAYVFCVFGSLLFRFVQACLYGSLTQMFARGRQLTLDFPAALRISAIAVTPVIVLRTLVWFLPSEPAWYIRWPIAIVITLGYLRFAVSALAAEPADAPAAPIAV